ncbi:MAG TPA: glycine cleavage system protein GcvH [Steroidobacteraceae bacterium]
MSNTPNDLKYTKSHEWVRQVAGGVEVGITDHAQSALGDLVFAEVPEIGKNFKAGDAAAVVESVKAASDVYSPVAGKVVAANEALSGKPELLNEDPYGKGWLFRLETAADLSSLMNAEGYEAFLAAEAH